MQPTDPGRRRELLCKDDTSSTASPAPSFRVYYSLAPRTVPFLWESQPGTPKDGVHEEPTLPPLTPPPSFQSKLSKLDGEGRRKETVARAGLLHTILRRNIFSSRKDRQLDQQRRSLPVSPAHSGLLSLASSSTSSSSTSSLSVSSPIRPTFFFEEQEARSKLQQPSRSPARCLPIGSPCRTRPAGGRWWKEIFPKK